MSETSKCVGLNDEQTPTPNVRNAVQLTSLADSGSAIDALPTGPEIFFVPAPNKALKINAPNHISRLHKIQRRKRNTDRCRPPVLVIRASEVQTPSQPESPSPFSAACSSVIKASRCMPSGLT